MKRTNEFGLTGDQAEGNVDASGNPTGSPPEVTPAEEKSNEEPKPIEEKKNE